MERTICVSEDLGERASSPYRFCATLVGDTDPERGGFGSTERDAIGMLAQQLGVSPAALELSSTIERVGVR